MDAKKRKLSNRNCGGGDVIVSGVPNRTLCVTPVNVDVSSSFPFVQYFLE